MEARQLIRSLMNGGLTQKEIARHIGMSQGAVSKLLHGQLADVTSRRHQKLLELHTDMQRRLKRMKKHKEEHHADHSDQA